MFLAFLPMQLRVRSGPWSCRHWRAALCLPVSLSLSWYQLSCPSTQSQPKGWCLFLHSMAFGFYHAPGIMSPTSKSIPQVRSALLAVPMKIIPVQLWGEDCTASSASSHYSLPQAHIWIPTPSASFSFQKIPSYSRTSGSSFLPFSFHLAHAEHPLIPVPHQDQSSWAPQAHSLSWQVSEHLSNQS